LDVLVNSAGVSRIRPLADSGEDEVDLMIAVNLKGPLFMAKHAVQAMLRQGDGGAIVNIASATVTRARRDLPVYIATKGAVAALTRSLAIDFAGDGIRANCVSPSATETPMLREHYRTAPDGDAEYRRNIAGVPLQRLATPQEIAHAILFLASDESSYVTGQVLGVDGGSTAGILMH
jgi:NAD(P)-dependent dehydrogenase (short-subunit alcohol dehydrogenase family)